MGDGQRTRVLDLDLPAVSESCPRARHAVQEALADAAVDLAAVGIAVTEAVANAVLHAYRHCDGPGRVRIDLGLTEHAAYVVVTDEGLGMVPNPDSPGLGLGLSLIANACDDLQIEQGAGGTRVRMRFTFAR